MANWCILLTEVACILLALVHLGVPEAIMCVRCQSTKDTKQVTCEKNPPNPTRCPTASDDQEYCMIAREYHKNGTLRAFIRDCSTTKMGDECKILDNNGSPDSPHKICYRTCDYDGCNQGTHAADHIPLTTLMTIVITCHITLLFQGNFWAS